MSQTIRLTADCQEYGGKGQYVARITGRDSKFTFEREFIGTRSGKRNEYTAADVDDPGLYEIRDVDKKGRKDDSYHVVLTIAPDEGFEDTLRERTVSKEDAMVIAKRLGAGERIEDFVTCAGQGLPAVILPPGAAKRAKAAGSIQDAADQCYAVLQALPVEQALKVLAALKTRLKPPAPKPEPAPEAVSACTADEIREDILS